jgi:uncharacterized membrane protein YbaN (DUF454 family)
MMNMEQTAAVQVPGRAEIRDKIKRALYIGAGTICVALGTLGIILPVLPTTPFLLAAAAFYLRGSARMYRWLHTNRLFGEYLRRYRSGEGLPLKVKISTISLLWISLGASALFAIPDSMLWVRILLGLIGTGVTIHLVRIRTSR